MSLSREAVVGLACSVTAGPVPGCRGVYLPRGLVCVWPCPAQPDGALGPPLSSCGKPLGRCLRLLFCRHHSVPLGVPSTDVSVVKAESPPSLREPQPRRKRRAVTAGGWALPPGAPPDQLSPPPQLAAAGQRPEQLPLGDEAAGEAGRGARGARPRAEAEPGP